MKKIIVIPVIIVVLIGLIIFYYSQQTGYIKIEATGFETDLNLIGRWGSKAISVSASEPVGIRTGTYKPERIVVRLTKTSDQWWSILCRREPWGKLATINVAKGNTTTLKLGPPLEIRTDVQRRNRTVSIGLALVGQACEHYSPEVLTHNGPLPAPAFTIVDKSGQKLAVGKFEYG
ncbi:MAG TPA: hypothetical protein DIU00_03100 [Phycisphaerales bacterium]|nr:hypothetical protein [Phycisphaerales bacterium]